MIHQKIIKQSKNMAKISTAVVTRTNENPDKIK